MRSVRGVLASAMLASAIGMRGIVIPDPCGPEAEVVDGITVHAVRHLGEIIAALRGEQALRPPVPGRASPPRDTAVDIELLRTCVGIASTTRVELGLIELSWVAPTEYRTDVVVVLHGRTDRRPACWPASAFRAHSRGDRGASGDPRCQRRLARFEY